MKGNDRYNMIAAIVLCLAIWLGWLYWFSPKPQPVAPRPAAPASAPAAAATETPAATPAAPAPAPAAEAAAAQPNAPGFEKREGDPSRIRTEIRTKNQRIVLSAYGGEVQRWELLQFPAVPGAEDAAPVDLVSREAKEGSRFSDPKRVRSKLPLHVVTGDAALDSRLAGALCAVDEAAPTPEELERHHLPAGTQRRRFTWADGQGLELEKTLYVPDDDRYLSVVEWSVRRGGQPLENAAIWWGPSIGQVEEHASTYGSYRGIVNVASGSGKADYTPGKVEADVPLGSPRWAAITDQYFTVALLPVEPAPMVLRVDADTKQLALTSASNVVTLFTGPKATKLLGRIDQQLKTNLEKMVPWGWWEFLARPLYWMISFIHGYIPNWGWAIVVATFLIRLAFFPLTQNAMVKMRRNQEQMSKIKPKLDRIREKYRGQRDMESRRKLNEETMEAYRKEGINPMAAMSGCLPLLLQIPVLFAFYKVLTVATELRGAPFLGWLQDLSAMDPYYITPLLMGATMLIQQLMSMTKATDPQAKMQQRMMLIIPVIFTYSFRTMPSGLVLYWLVSNLLSIAQQVLINRQAAQVPARAS